MPSTGTTTIRFSRGIPPPDAIPSQALARCVARVLEEDPELAFQYAPIGRNRGDESLREELALMHNADPDGVFVGNGSLQVLDLLAGRLLEGGGEVCVEAPTYDRAIQIIERHGGRPVGIPLEHDGIDVEALERHVRARRPAFVYTIPDFQNPSGVTASAAKRRALVELVERHELTLVEDTPYRRLRYHGSPSPALADVDTTGRVITLGSLSKVLSPGLRVGYAICRPGTALSLAAAAEGTYLSPVPLCQAVAARALAEGLAESNVKRVCDVLRPRHDAAVAVVEETFPGALLAVPGGGYFVSLHLPVAGSEDDLTAAARLEGVALTRGSSFYPRSLAPPDGTAFVRLPFQALDPAIFALGVARLAIAAQAGARPAAAVSLG